MCNAVFTFAVVATHGPVLVLWQVLADPAEFPLLLLLLEDAGSSSGMGLQAGRGQGEGIVGTKESAPIQRPRMLVGLEAALDHIAAGFTSPEGALHLQIDVAVPAASHAAGPHCHCKLSSNIPTQIIRRPSGPKATAWL